MPNLKKYYSIVQYYQIWLKLLWVYITKLTNNKLVPINTFFVKAQVLNQCTKSFMYSPKVKFKKKLNARIDFEMF
jgi:hypothetical protein